MTHRATFIEVALMVAHLTSADTAPRGANLRSLGSAFGAAFAAITKKATIHINGIPFP